MAWYDELRDRADGLVSGQNVAQRAYSGLDFSVNGILPNVYGAGVRPFEPLRFAAGATTTVAGASINYTARQVGTIGSEAAKGLFGGLGPRTSIALAGAASLVIYALLRGR